MNNCKRGIYLFKFDNMNPLFYCSLIFYKKIINGKGKIMLVKFTVKNYKSFKDENTFSCIEYKSKDNPNFPFTLNNSEYINNYFSMIVGENASGKTNFLEALSDFSYFVLTSNKLKRNEKISCYKPFILDNLSEKKPTSFDIEFITKENQYYYKIKFSEDEILNEELWMIQNNKNKIIPILIYVRRLLDFEVDSKVIHQVGNIYDDIALNRPILSVIRENLDFSIIEDAFSFFKRDLSMCFLQKKEVEGIINKYRTAKLLNNMPEVKPLVIAFLKLTDIHISDININMYNDVFYLIKKKELDNYPKERSLLSDLTDTTSFKHSIFDINNKIEENIFSDYENSEATSTMKMYEIVDELIGALLLGSTVFIDSFNSYFDMKVVNFIFKLFTTKEFNRRGAQIIITIRDYSLIENLELSKEQIWITKKNNRGASDLLCSKSLKEVSDKSLSKQNKFNEEQVMLKLFKKVFNNYYNA